MKTEQSQRSTPGAPRAPPPPSGARTGQHPGGRLAPPARQRRARGAPAGMPTPGEYPRTAAPTQPAQAEHGGATPAPVPQFPSAPSGGAGAEAGGASPPSLPRLLSSGAPHVPRGARERAEQPPTDTPAQTEPPAQGASPPPKKTQNQKKPTKAHFGRSARSGGSPSPPDPRGTCTPGTPRVGSPPGPAHRGRAGGAGAGCAPPPAAQPPASTPTPAPSPASRRRSWGCRWHPALMGPPSDRPRPAPARPGPPPPHPAPPRHPPGRRGCAGDVVRGGGPPSAGGGRDESSAHPQIVTCHQRFRLCCNQPCSKK